MGDGTMAIPKFGEPGAAALASLAAGPAFVTVATLADFYRGIPATFEISGADILALLQMMPLVLPIGALIAFAPNMLGTIVMSQWSHQSWLARTPVAWIVAGGAFGGALGQVLTGGDTWGLTAPFVVTGALCAAVCRLFVDLDHDGAA
jgi:hypothetical protein